MNTVLTLYLIKQGQHLSHAYVSKYTFEGIFESNIHQLHLFYSMQR